MDAFEKLLAWDIDTRMGNTDTRGAFLNVTEFDYTAVNKVIYQKNGVTIRTIPAIHIFDGPVSFILEWNGLKFAYSSDTFPNKWWLKYTKNVDISIHECFVAPESLVEKQGFTPQAALNVGTQIHTSPAQFGKVMAETKPRLAVGYHFFNDFDTTPSVLRDIRMTYDGELALATDYIRWCRPIRNSGGSQCPRRCVKAAWCTGTCSRMSTSTSTRSSVVTRRCPKRQVLPTPILNVRKRAFDSTTFF
jgi:ribonuclease Z